MLIRFSNATSHNAQGQDRTVGRVQDVLFDDSSWNTRYFVVNSKKWFGGKRVLVSPQSVKSLLPNQPMTLGLTAKQIRNCPDEETDQPLSRQFESQLHSYYGWTPYWATTLTGRLHPYGPYLYGRLGDAIPGGIVQILEERKESDLPILRSCKELIGYRMSNTQGEIGSVSDFFIDNHSFEVLYLAVDTGDWFPGRKVLVPHHMVSELSWSDRNVSVIAPHHIVKSAPLADDLDHDPERDPGVLEHYFAYFIRAPRARQPSWNSSSGFGRQT